jgi:hypothetical protein
MAHVAVTRVEGLELWGLLKMRHFKSARDDLSLHRQMSVSETFRLTGKENICGGRLGE